MEDSTRELLSQIQQLRLELAEIRVRVSAVEAVGGIPARLEHRDSEPSAIAAQARESGDRAEAGNLAALFGWAFLGLSGGYLLRGFTESGTVPALAGVVAGVLYAGSWLFAAAARTVEKPVASAVYSSTAALILAPLLWEATVRFQVFSPAVAAGVLVLFVLFGLGIAWRYNLTGVAWVTTISGMLTPIAIFREVHDGSAWVAGIIAIAGAVELAACRDRWLGLRWVVAAAADLTVLLLTYLVTAVHGTADFPRVATPQFLLGAQVALLFVYLASTADRTLARKLPITAFEVGQAAVAFVISVGGALRLVDATSLGWKPVAIFCAAAGAACYAVSFAMLDRKTQPSRNFYTYSTFGILLSIVASRLLAQGDSVAVAWGAMSVCLVIGGVFARRRTLCVHGCGLLLLAVVAAEIVPKGWTMLAEPAGAVHTGIEISYVAVLTAALVSCGVLAFASTHAAELFICLMALSWSLAGAIASAAMQMDGAAPLRTAVLMVCAIAVARLSASTQTPALSWIAYGFVGATGLKLMLVDLRAPGSLSVFVSLLIFGTTLILVPRLARRGESRTTADRAMSKGAGL